MTQMLALVAAIALVGFIAYVATRPNELRVTREALIAAPPERIYGHLVNLRGWQAWSPWEKKDPAMKRTFEARNTAEFTLAATGGSTHVVWVMYGPANFISKLMGVFMNMDRMIGSDFEAGLANLKALCEKPAG